MDSKKIKIGIFSKKLSNLRPFEYRIFHELYIDKEIDLAVLFFDGRQKTQNNFNYRLKSFIKSKKISSKILLKIQEYIETKIFRDKSFKPENELIKYINSIKKVNLYPKSKGFLDVFTKNDCQKVDQFNLDVIIRTEFNIIRGDILNIPKQGIWSFHHGDNRVNRGGPPCFWEIIEKHKNIGVTLQRLTPELDGGKVIDRGSYNIHWSLVRSRRIVYDSSIVLLFKNLNLLKSKKISLSDSSEYKNRLYKFPTLIYSLKYIINFYKNCVIKIFQKIISHFNIRKYNHWTLSFSEGNFFHTPIDKLKLIKTPKNEFWADPFLVEKDNIKYIFFENYDYSNKIGKISCGQVKGDNLINIKDVLVKDYHLSYPFIYQKDNEIYMIPESSANNKLEVYKCDDFPEKWSLYSSAFEGEKVKDCNIYEDENKNLWVFLNKKKYNSDDCSDLYIYKIDSLKFENIYSHKYNPVITDSTRARNAGPIFSFQNKLFRPSQVNINGQYGAGLNINQIISLSLNDYKERIVETYIPDFDKNINGLHHIHFQNNFFVIDLCKQKI